MGLIKVFIVDVAKFECNTYFLSHIVELVLTEVQKSDNNVVLKNIVLKLYLLKDHCVRFSRKNGAILLGKLVLFCKESNHAVLCKW